MKRKKSLRFMASFICYSDEESGHRACTSGHLTTANQGWDLQSESYPCHSGKNG